MDTDKQYKYYLKYESEGFELFQSQFYFDTEASCLEHFEKGIQKKIFHLDHSKINQVWSQLGLWGLVGRTCPVELVRVLCAYGCNLEVFDQSQSGVVLTKSYHPLKFYIPMKQTEFEIIKNVVEIPLSEEMGLKVQPFLNTDKELILGSFYRSTDVDSDSVFPKFCNLLEKDICLPSDSISKVLSRLFFMGFEIMCEDNGQSIVLAKYDQKMKSLKGFGYEQTLFYIGES